MSEPIQGFLNPEILVSLKTMAVAYLPKLGLALLTLFVGLWIVGGFVKVLRSTLEKKEFDPSLTGFLTGLVRIGLKVLLIISVAGMVGIETTSFIAVLGAAGLAVGLALQGSLANFAGAVLILLFKPFRVGDYIKVSGEDGTVDEIGIFTTRLKTVDNRRIYIPNGSLASSVITNFSQEELRRLDLTVGIAYSDDIRKAKSVLEDVLKSEPRFLKEPEPVIAVAELGSSSVDLIFRPWVKATDYWPTRWATIEKIKLTFDEEGLNFPFPQRDVHLYKTD